MGTTFLESFDRQVAFHPDKTALVDEFRTMTYGKLSCITHRMATRLRGIGVGDSTSPDRYDIDAPPTENSPWVIVLSGRSIDVVAGILAALRAGGAYVAVPDDAPDSHLDHILQTTNAAAVLCAAPERHLPLVRYVAEQRVFDWRAFADDVTPDAQIPPDPSGAFEPRDLALAVFTSGSTGKPKGAVLERCSLDRMIAWQVEYMRPRESGQTAAYAPFGFIASQWELFWPLAAGQTLHILSDAVRHDLFLLERYLIDNKIEFVFMPPDIAESYSQACNPGSLRHVRVAGGALRSCARTPYIIDYSLGMSENSGSVTFHPIRQAWEKDIPLGHPFPGTTITLLDENGRPARDGEAGEMAVSGPMLARGYLGLPEENARRFVRNPGRNPGASGEDDALMFLSGDIARKRPDGMLEYLGRRDRMAKIRGMRVEPRAVELALGALPGVEACVVMPLTNALGGNVLAAWYAGLETDANQMKRDLAKTLPEYMIPAFLVHVASIPRNVNGKVDVAALPTPISQSAFEPKGGAPANTLEAEICTLFAESLGRSDDFMPGPLDNFLELGGNSLGLLSLQMRLRGQYGVDVAYSDLFVKATPRAAAELVGKAPPSCLPAPPVRDKQSSYALTPQERQMWLLWKLDRGKGTYEVEASCSIKGPLDMPRLQDALAALTKRHDMLRARFTELDGEPVMIVEDDSVSVPTLPTLIERGEVDSDRRIDLSIPPLFIPVLEQPGDGGFVLRLRTHHIVADAIALRVLLDELWALYNGTALLPATQFHDFAYRESGDVKVEAFWQERFADGVPCLRLPEDYLRPPALLKGAGRVEAWLDGDADAALTREAAKAGCSRFQWLVAAWAVLLNALSASEDDIIVGVPFAGRDSPETQACVGMFVRTLPLRLRLERDGTFAELLPVVRNAFLDAWNNQACPLERMAQLVRPPRLPGRNPFFDVMVNHVPLPRPLPDVPGLEIETLGQDAPEALFDLILDIRDERDGTALAVRYARDLFAHETAERWLDMLCGIVRKSVREPATLIRNIVPGAREQTARVREVWPETCTETEPDAEAEEVPDAKEKRKILMAAWRDQLGRDPETPEDNFFHSGGDSLKAIRMESRLRAAGWVLFAPDMFLKPGFGAMLAAMRREDAPAPDYAASENDDGASPDVLDLFTSEWSGDDD